MTAPAFTVQGVPITTEQRDAALAVMTGVFGYGTVRRALCHAGVGRSVADRAADRILQSERKAGRIRVAKGLALDFDAPGMWERIA